MPPQMREVFSSHVNKTGYDDQARELWVQWDTGKTSVYEGVPDDVAQSVMNSWSVGTAIRERIKPQYPHRYV
jgi:hypothetical protein